MEPLLHIVQNSQDSYRKQSFGVLVVIYMDIQHSGRCLPKVIKYVTTIYILVVVRDIKKILSDKKTKNVGMMTKSFESDESYVRKII